MTTWKKKKRLPGGGRWMAGGMTGSALYVTGGDRADGSPDGKLWVYDLERETWRRGPDMPHRVSGHTCVILGGALWCLGGRGESGPTDLTQVYHIEAATWSMGPPLPQPRWQHCACAISGGILCMGGTIGDGIARADAWRYTPSTGRWQKAPPLPTPRRNACSALLAGSVYCVGGAAGADSRAVDTVERWDIHTGGWQACAPLPAPRRYPGCGVRGKALHVLGGSGDSGMDVLEDHQWSRASGPDVSGCCMISGAGRLFALGGFGKGGGYSPCLWELVP